MVALQNAIARAKAYRTAQRSGARAVMPAPVRGLNTQDPEGAMDALYATALVNWFPDRGRVITRKGSTEYVDISGEMGEIGTLHTWLSGGDSKLFAFSASSVWDVTDPDSPSEDVSSGVTNAFWRGANSNGNSVFVNGVDTPLRVDAMGDFVAHGFSGTGLAVTNLNTVTLHRNRLYFTEKDSSKVWYGGTDSVTGTLTAFDLGGVVPEGGNCLAIGTISLDTGEGPDDILAIFMSRGQVVIYTGGDPSSSDWALSGIFNLSPVIGPRPLVKLGGDLIAITADGYMPILQFLGAGREQRQLALSDKIAPTVSRAVARFGTEAGWQAIYAGETNWLLFNLGDQGGGAGVQHVMNTTSGAWTTFEGMPARCWEEFGGKLYYGTAGGRVIEANAGDTDDGSRIRYYARGAYNYLGSPYDKHLRMVRPNFLNDRASVNVRFGVVADFDARDPSFNTISLVSEGTLWDEGLWDEFLWAEGEQTFRDWIMVDVRGSAMAAVTDLYGQGGELSWTVTDVLYDSVPGSILTG